MQFESGSPLAASQQPSAQHNCMGTGDAYERHSIDVCRTENGRIKFIRDYWKPHASQTSNDNVVTQRG